MYATIMQHRATGVGDGEQKQRVGSVERRMERGVWRRENEKGKIRVERGEKRREKGQARREESGRWRVEQRGRWRMERVEVVARRGERQSSKAPSSFLMW